MNGAELIAAERQRQVEEEGWTSEHDDEHKSGGIALAAACYAIPHNLRHRNVGGWIPHSLLNALWPWDFNSWKPVDPVDIAIEREGNVDYPRFQAGDKHEARRRELVKAGALIAAEIDRLQRLDHEAVSVAPGADQQETKGEA